MEGVGLLQFLDLFTELPVPSQATGVVENYIILCMCAMYITSLTDSFDDRTSQFRFHLMIMLPHRHLSQELAYILSVTATMLDPLDYSPELLYIIFCLPGFERATPIMSS